MGITKEMISVIIPVFNRENVINECIQSILVQSYQNFELIIVDDDSDDDTYEICNTLATNEPRIKLFKISHGGVSAARNMALDHANGEYIFFIDSDDVIHPRLLETLILGMKEKNASIGATNVVNVHETLWYKVAQKLALPSKLGEVTPYNADDIIDIALKGNSPLSCIGGVMMHRDLIGDTRFRTDIYIGEDFYFIYENIIKKTVGILLKQKWYYVRIHEHNSSWDYSFNGFWTRFYRRKLVWESEEKLGRTNHAIIQKKEAFYFFSLCIDKNKPYSSDGRKMIQVLKKYKETIYPALSTKGKIAYNLYSYFPATATLLFKLDNKLLKSKKS